MALLKKTNKGEAAFQLASDALDKMFCYVENYQWHTAHMQQLMNVLTVSVSGKTYCPGTIVGVWNMVSLAAKNCNNQDKNDINALQEVFNACKKLMFEYNLWAEACIELEQAQSNVEAINSQIAAQLAFAPEPHPMKAKADKLLSQ